MWTFNKIYIHFISDDVVRAEQGLGVQYYDAFVLCTESDWAVVSQMIYILEDQAGLKVIHNLSWYIYLKYIIGIVFVFQLCIKERDLLGGLTFEHDAIRRLISERCTRLILIISPDFVESPENEFYLNYAQAQSIGNQISCISNTKLHLQN